VTRDWNLQERTLKSPGREEGQAAQRRGGERTQISHSVAGGGENHLNGWLRVDREGKMTRMT